MYYYYYYQYVGPSVYILLKPLMSQTSAKCPYTVYTRVLFQKRQKCMRYGCDKKEIMYIVGFLLKCKNRKQ